jgi:hypothetical protein
MARLTPVEAWIEACPRVVAHLTSTHASWMNLVEVRLSVIERQAVHRGTFGWAEDPDAGIRVHQRAERLAPSLPPGQDH